MSRMIAPSVDPVRLAREGWTVHRPRRTLQLVDLRQLYEYRELLLLLFWRDVTIKHKQMLLGVSWTVLQPVVQMVVFSAIFGHFARLPSENGLPYPILVYAALLPWQYFSASLGRCTTSLVADQALVKKVAFPRLLVPIAALLPGLVDFAISFAVFGFLMAWFRVPPAWTLVFVPVFLALAMVTALALGLWLSGLNVRYRDVQYVLPFLLQAWMLITPVAYSAQIIPRGIWRFLYEMNPLTVVVKGVRWATLGTEPLAAVHVIPVGLVLAVLGGGLLYFRHAERAFADVI